MTLEVIAYLERCRAVDDKVLEALACDADADTADLLAADLDFDFTGVVDEDTVAAVGDVEGHAFVGLVGGGSAVLVPDADGLPWHNG